MIDLEWCQRQDEAWLRRLVMDMAKEALSRNDISAGAKNLIESYIDGFKVLFDEVAAADTGGKCDKTSAIGAIECAFGIAALSSVDEKILNALRTKAANKGKKAAAVGDIIENIARRFWAKNKSFEKNPTGTAKAIQPAVSRALTEAIACKEQIPPSWRRSSDSTDAIKKEVERIRQRVMRMQPR